MEYKNNQMNDNQQLIGALQGVRKAVQGEREDELFYDYLMSEAPTREEKEIIASIRDDERRHNRLFRRIYQDFTGMEVPMSYEEETFEAPESYLGGIKKALFGELGAVERYRAIRRGLPMGPYRDILFDIITDELKHASKYNYLFTLNSTANNSFMSGNVMRQDITNTASTTNVTGTIGATGTTTTGTIGTTGATGTATTGTTTGATGTSNVTTTTNTNATSPTDTINFTPDDWVRFISPLVNRAMTETKGSSNREHLYQKFILAGLLVGLGKEPRDAINQVEEWEKTGTSKLLAMSKMSRYFNDLEYI
jgi:rubrerythrin